jgi:hypothetical protein
MKPGFLLLLIILIMHYSCQNETKVMQYELNRYQGGLPVNTDWDIAPWNAIDAVPVSNFMGTRPEHFPQTLVKVAYDTEAIYVKFRVEDRYVKAVHKKNQDPVYKDSCVEFFFTPGTDVGKGYFNLEMNCGGTMLFHHQVVPRKGAVPIAETDIREIEVATSLPQIVDPELSEATTWIVSYRIPFSILKKYHDFENPAPGTIWRANFYKCADETSHPHWLTWAPVKLPKPDFHRPEFFGELHF